MSAPEKNQNAAKEEPATSFLHIRATPRQKARWVRAAQTKKTKLAPWVITTLDAASPPDPPEQ